MNKFIHIIILVSLSTGTVIRCSNLTDCKKPDDVQLEEMLLDSSIEFQQFIASHMNKRNSVQTNVILKSTNPMSIMSRKLSQARGSVFCQQKVTSLLNENAYPEREVIMECERTKFMTSSFKGWKCLPKFDYRPVLLKFECGHDGLFVYKRYLRKNYLYCSMVKDNLEM